MIKEHREKQAAGSKCRREKMGDKPCRTSNSNVKKNLSKNKEREERRGGGRKERKGDRGWG